MPKPIFLGKKNKKNISNCDLLDVFIKKNAKFLIPLCVTRGHTVLGKYYSGFPIRFALDEYMCFMLNLYKNLQEGQLSVSGERMCTILVNRLEH